MSMLVRTLALSAVIVCMTTTAMSRDMLTCYCSSCSSNRFSCKTSGACYEQVSYDNQHQLVSSEGCLDQHSVMLCSKVGFRHRTKCCKSDWCNVNFDQALPPLPSTIEPLLTLPDSLKQVFASPADGPVEVDGSGPRRIVSRSTVEMILMIALPAAVLSLCGILIIHFRGRLATWWSPKCKKGSQESVIHLFAKKCLPKEPVFSSVSSGAGPMLMDELTISKQVRLHELIGKGRFGDVTRGTWNGLDVAVKIFRGRENESWLAETHVYQNTSLRHENILGFIASDKTVNLDGCQYWLVFEYHSNGSLFDYLGTARLQVSDAMKILTTTVFGLAHLHMEIKGVGKKPPIAHRDIKSKNILVKKDGSCCVADLGLALVCDSSADSFKAPSGDIVGTKRYLAPEVLDGTFDRDFFDSYRQLDIYALGLVFWEVLRRVDIDGVEPRELPYFDLAPGDPTVKEMHDIVSVRKARPAIAQRLTDHPILSPIIQIMIGSWHQCPLARLPILNLQKRLLQLLRQVNEADAAKQVLT